jgi:hypothetical protein
MRQRLRADGDGDGDGDGDDLRSLHRWENGIAGETLLGCARRSIRCRTLVR